MRIACVANMNNMMFVLCRYLRDEGFDAELITLEDEPSHFTPASDSYSDDYLNYFSVLPYTKSTLFSNDAISTIKSKLGGYDFFIGTDIAPALLALIGKKLDVYIPHGSDIFAFPFESKRPSNVNKIWWLREKVTLRKYQRIGIQNTSAILFPDEYDNLFKFKNKLPTEAVYYNTSGPMVYSIQYEHITESEFVKKLPNYNRFSKLRDENELLIFSHSRHNGFHLKPSSPLHQKGNDILICGFAKFIKFNPNLRCKLILFEYGRDVDASKNLIGILGIQDHVVWMPLMERKEIMLGLNMSDIVCGHFENSWLTCGVVNETLASNKPLLHYREDVLYKNDYPTLYPLLNVKTAEDVYQRLSEFLKNPEQFKKEAKSGSTWLFKYTVEYPLQIIKSTIDNKPAKSSDLSRASQSDCLKILKKHHRQEYALRIIAKLSKNLR
jgi:hypothetical protein